MTTISHEGATAAGAQTRHAMVIRTAFVHPNPANVRDDLGDLSELADSIAAHGILQPLLVQPHPDRGDGEYELLAGHRRLAAAQQAGLTTVPVIVRPAVDSAEALELMLVENVQRRDLNPMDKAEAMAELRDRGYTNTKIAQRTGITVSTVSYYLQLMRLAPETRERVRSGKLSAADAVNAVRTVRRQDREKRTGSSINNYEWEPDYLAGTHPLAKKARKLCDARDHGMRRRIGKTACGQCWETVIRQDERVVIETEQH
ncbi:hypothetical protein GCM10023191_101700 [Actinoallomurus oryzae]|uniref:ParB-like N-terminal domain-containing protein n=1 Tax=Actinoallomurus oryzae TaxID=502180 RepID=A0ABP8R9E2_9ACTN